MAGHPGGAAHAGSCRIEAARSSCTSQERPPISDERGYQCVRLAMRRPVLRMILAILMVLLTACGGIPAVSPTTTLVTQMPTTAAPAATTAPTAARLPTTMSSTTTTATTAVPEAPAPGALPDVPRNQTLVLGWATQSPIGVTNPWAVPGYTHQEGNNLLWEGLAYYAIFADKDIPWLADSMEYTKPDFTELTIKLNKQATWSDGVPITSNDVVFTFEGQMNSAM